MEPCRNMSQKRPLLWLPCPPGGGARCVPSAPWVVLGLIAFLVAGCCPEVRGLDSGAAQGQGDGSRLRAALTNIQGILLDRHCVTDCHEQGNAAAGLQLTRGSSYSNLVNKPSQQITSVLRVAPSDPDKSYLVRKLEGTGGIVGGGMPRRAPPRPASEVEMVRTWITRGAPND